jgi:hypothetical protein
MTKDELIYSILEKQGREIIEMQKQIGALAVVSQELMTAIKAVKR